MQFFGMSTIGRIRENNEDCFHVPTSGDRLQNVFIVADGMGGENAGEVASMLAISAAYTKLSEEYDGSPDSSLLLRRAVLEANRVVLETARSDSRYRNMGTTMVAAIIRDGLLSIANVGDSRAYLMHHGELMRATNDHSFVQEMVDKGVLTEKEAREHPSRNLITRAIGVSKLLEVDVFTFPWEKGDKLLLATDGLTNMVGQDRIAEVLKNSQPEAAVRALLQEANVAGGKDNITAVCVSTDEGEQA